MKRKKIRRVIYKLAYMAKDKQRRLVVREIALSIALMLKISMDRDLVMLIADDRARNNLQALEVWVDRMLPEEYEGVDMTQLCTNIGQSLIAHLESIRASMAVN